MYEDSAIPALLIIASGKSNLLIVELISSLISLRFDKSAVTIWDLLACFFCKPSSAFLL